MRGGWGGWGGLRCNLEREGSEGADDRDEEDVDVSDEDDGTLVGDDLAHAGIGKGAPLVDIKDLVGIRDEAVALEVRGEGHEEHAEHGVATVPALSVGGDAKAAGSELRGLLGEFSNSRRHRVGLLHHDACTQTDNRVHMDGQRGREKSAAAAHVVPRHRAHGLTTRRIHQRNTPRNREETGDTR